MILTLNSEFDRYGNRLNLIINYHLREYYFNDSHTADVGEVINNLPISEVENKEKELRQKQFTKVPYWTLRIW